MKLLNAGLATLILTTALLLGCWKQHDEIYISGDGSTTFLTTVTITELGFGIKDVDGLTNEYMTYLRRAGWKVDKDWVSKAKPFKLTFKGSGNLKTVKSASDFYRIQKVDDNSVRMWFLPAESKGGKSSRSISFNTELIGGAKVFDSLGQRIASIENANGKVPYLVVFR